ncbi:MAG: acyltransferase domain-containing protein, partial [Candidatus Heimdallarchaeota archaeon]|nr:acyltransferase domain-containing protein [Candidatus Heimdallarchaeota archaeon]
MIKGSKLQLPKLYTPEPIAIVGLGGIFPDAKNIDEFWENIKSGHSAIRQVSKDRWDPDMYYDKDRSAPDKTYTTLGAFVEGFEFNSFDYRIPPNIVKQIDIVQQFALYAAKEALEDANYKSDSFPSQRTAVIIGNSAGGEIKSIYNRRIFYPFVAERLKLTDLFKNLSPDDQDTLLEEFEKSYKDVLTEITEDSMPGELPNIISGRIAAVFNLRGMNITSDAACASSLAAIEVAFKGLLTHEYDAAVVGGADRSMGPTTFVKFCKIGALSAEGSFPFDARANGFVMGEGAGMFVLKRLSDAIKADDKIYSLIIGVGASSDGKGKGITAPNPIGQELAVRRAYEQIGISPQDVQLIEAHGTSTSVGDKVEFTSLDKVFKEYNVAKHSIKIGSIKSQIGHLKSAAGAAAIIKIALGLHHQIVPPSINFETPNPNMDWDSSSFVVNTKSIPWDKPLNVPRRAGISSFGFGGTNFHLILEEYDTLTEYEPSRQINFADLNEKITEGTPSGLSWFEYIDRNLLLEKEPIIVSAKSEAKLLEIINLIPEMVKTETLTSSESGSHILDLVKQFTYNETDKFRAGLAIPSFNETSRLTELAVGAISNEKRKAVARARGIYVSKGLATGKTAFVFPGQGSQYSDMLYDLSMKYQIIIDTFAEADRILADRLEKPLSKYIFADGRDRKEVEADLRQTQTTQPAMLTVDIALFRLFTEFGITPDLVAGHSLGEYAALVAAGVLDFKDALIAVAIRGKAMSEVDVYDKGAMASISATIEEVEQILENVDGYIVAANKNSISQTVISGSTEGVENAIKEFESRGITAIKLSVSAAFHTEIVEPANVPLSEWLDGIMFHRAKIPITSNVTGEFYPKNPEKIRDLLKKQVGSAVEWTKQVQTMFDDGATTFFEVGPKRALTGFIDDILSDSNILSVVSNHPKKGGIQSFNEAVSAAAAIGVKLTRPSPKSD